MTNYDILKEYEAHQTPVPSYDEWMEKTKSLKVLAEAYCKEKQQNAQLKKQINHLLKTQARQFVDNQKLQVKAEKAKDVVNIDTARQIKQVKELLKQSRIYVKIDTEDYDDRAISKADKDEAKKLLAKIDEALKCQE